MPAAHSESRFRKIFWAKAAPTENGCWRWTGSRNKQGYGRGMRHGRYFGAHRMAWELTHGAIPPGACVLHRCDNPSCVNPAHLFLGSQRDNRLDCLSKGRDAPRVAAILGSRNPNSRLTADDIRSIRARYALRGTTKSEIARDFGVTDVLVGMIVRRKIWRHI